MTTIQEAKTEMRLAGNVLDSLLGLPLSAPDAVDKIMQAVEVRFSELENAMIWLTFHKLTDGSWLEGDESTDDLERYTMKIDQELYNAPELRAEVAALGLLRFDYLELHAS